jgi:hypothetical protein
MVASGRTSTSVLAAGDVDGDGDVDIVGGSAAGRQLAWYESHAQHNADFLFSGVQHAVASLPHGVTSLALGDVDGDGDLDIIVAMADSDTVAWVANVGASVGACGERFSCTVTVLTSSALRVSSVVLGDVDADDDADVVFASSGDGSVSWLENSGSGVVATSFPSPPVLISAACAGAADVALGDIDADGSIDVVAACPGAASVNWFRSRYSDAATAPSAATLFDATAWNVSTSCGGVVQVTVHDVNADGYADVVAALASSGAVVWLPSTPDVSDPAAVFASSGDASSISPQGGTDVSGFALGDIDGDGDADVVGAGVWVDGLAWSESVGTSPASGLFSPTPIVVTTEHVGDYSTVPKVADFNNDGCMDMVVVSQRDEKVAIYDCVSGSGFDGTQHLIRPPVWSWWPQDVEVTDMYGSVRVLL